MPAVSRAYPERAGSRMFGTTFMVDRVTKPLAQFVFALSEFDLFDTIAGFDYY